MLVHVTNSQDIVELSLQEVEALTCSLIEYKQVPCDELSVHFVGVSDIAKLHEEYFNDPSPTDCITFPVDDTTEDTFYRVLGDVFVCPEVALDYAKKHLVSFEEELSLYVVHGILHLLGYDDIKDEEREIMRREEALCMEHLRKHQLILRPRLCAHVS